MTKIIKYGKLKENMRKTTRFYTTKEFAEICKVSRKSVYNWIKEGRIEARRIKQKWLIPEYELPAFKRNNNE